MKLTPDRKLETFCAVLPVTMASANKPDPNNPKATVYTEPVGAALVVTSRAIKQIEDGALDR